MNGEINSKSLFHNANCLNYKSIHLIFSHLREYTPDNNEYI